MSLARALNIESPVGGGLETIRLLIGIRLSGPSLDPGLDLGHRFAGTKEGGINHQPSGGPRDVFAGFH